MTTPDKPPLVLFHGLASSGPVAWKEPLPQLAAHHTVFTPTALGHRGGATVRRRPVTIWDVVDDAEHYLDKHELERPHLAGHSMGGIVALELARRGRAATVCALSPGGFWSPGDGLKEHVIGGMRRDAAMTRAVRPLVKTFFKSATVRRYLMRGGARRADRLSAAEAREMVDDAAACMIVDDLYSTDDEYVAPLNPLPCPITIAWSEKDEMLPLVAYERAVRQRLPAASLVILPSLGHVAMIDDPELVSRTILAVTTAPSGG